MNTSFQTTSEQSLGRFGNAQRLLGHLDANVISNLITTTADVVLIWRVAKGVYRHEKQR